MYRLTLLLVPFVLLVPGAAAGDDGTDATLRALYQSHDGSETWLAEYVAGAGEQQTWRFTNVGGQGGCDAWGSITWGFWGACIVTEGTGVYYATACPSWELYEDRVNGKESLVVPFC